MVDTEEEDWDRVIRNNLKSCFLCCKAAARQMERAHRSGIGFVKNAALYGSAIAVISPVTTTTSIVRMLR